MAARGNVVTLAQALNVLGAALVSLTLWIAQQTAAQVERIDARTVVLVQDVAELRGALGLPRAAAAAPHRRAMLEPAAD